MWFRRLFRRRRKPPPLDLPALDRLEELIARVIALVPTEVSPTPVAEPASRPVEPAGEPIATAHLLFLPGYELVMRNGPAPARGSWLDHDGRSYRVLRHGPSPLPGDSRRCAFLETA